MSQCDPWTLMNSLKDADETSFADRAASFKSLKVSLSWERESQIAMRHFQLFEKLLIKHGKWRLVRQLILVEMFQNIEERIDIFQLLLRLSQFLNH